MGTKYSVLAERGSYGRPKRGGVTFEPSSFQFRFSWLDEPERFIRIVIEPSRSWRWRQLALFECRDSPRSIGRRGYLRHCLAGRQRRGCDRAGNVTLGDGSPREPCHADSMLHEMMYVARAGADLALFRQDARDFRERPAAPAHLFDQRGVRVQPRAWLLGRQSVKNLFDVVIHTNFT